MIGHNPLQRNSLIAIGHNFNTTSVSLVTQASSCDNPLLLTWLLLDNELWYDGEDDVQLAERHAAITLSRHAQTERGEYIHISAVAGSIFELPCSLPISLPIEVRYCRGLDHYYLIHRFFWSWTRRPGETNPNNVQPHLHHLPTFPWTTERMDSSLTTPRLAVWTGSRYRP